MQRDAEYSGDDQKQRKRALFCRIVIALATNIRNHTAKVMTEFGGHVRMVPIPYLSFKYVEEKASTHLQDSVCMDTTRAGSVVPSRSPLGFCSVQPYVKRLL